MNFYIFVENIIGFLADKSNIMKEKNIKPTIIISIMLLMGVFIFVYMKFGLAIEAHPIDEQTQKWQNSHHQKSMQIANEDNVLGDFNDVEITFNKNKSRFFKNEGQFWVTTENNDYKIEYVFGFEPLQQYLIKMDGGKYQTLPLSWDNRAAVMGGQRWFHIYGDQNIPVNDRLHWQQPLQNWNGMCADCHSTGLKRHYDVETNSFDTTWQTINVSCNSCHISDNYQTSDDDNGWILEDGANTAKWSGDKRDQSEIEICAACHSRRAPLSKGFDPKDKFLDAFSPSPILIPEYFADGQIREEDYVWGSFLQSKMHSKGVICSDCHDPHSLELKVPGNELCSTCHQPQYFDNISHHNHQTASAGALCVNCHMTSRTYMQIDERHDHSFRIPRPDLNKKTSSPDACTTCHDQQKPEWAADHIKNWYGHKPDRPSHYGEILNDVFTGEAGAQIKLKQLLMDDQIAPIIKGSAFSLLVNYPNQASYDLIKDGLLSAEPLIRLGAVKASIFIPYPQRSLLLLPILSDEFRSVRVEAIRVLSDINQDNIENKFKQAYRDAKEEYLIAQNQTSWRGEGNFNLGLFYSAQNNIPLAQQNYLNAIDIDPYFTASYINLADTYRLAGDDDQNGHIIDKGLAVNADDPDLNYAKALHLIRNKQTVSALEYLAKALKNAPDSSHYAYVYAAALSEMGQKQTALEILRTAVKKSPNDGNLNMMLFNHYRATENYNEAIKYGDKLSILFPDNIMIKNIIEELQKKK